MFNSIKHISLIAISILCFASCKKEKKEKVATKDVVEVVKKDSIASLLKTKNFDTIVNGKKVQLYWIQNSNIKAAFTNYGGRIVGLWVADKKGKMIDVVAGMDSAKGFINSTEPYFGATIGRVGNRIAKGKFTLNGKEYSIPINNGENTLHGGKKGFQDVVWEAKKVNEHTIALKYSAADMEEGFPGNLDVTVTYSITEDNAVKMEYKATTDKPTVVNLTNHAFFNLNGEGSGSILNHKVQIYADKYTPVDAGLIPTGTIEDVEGTPFDFRTPHTIGERIEETNKQLTFGKGYDHNFVLNGNKKNGLNHVATIVGDKSGIIMDVISEEPGVQFYSGNFMQSKNTFKSGVKDDFRTTFALETQHFPDAPNQPNFPSITLNPGEEYHTVSLYKFSVENN